MLVFFPQLFLGKVFGYGDSAAFRPFSDFSRARWHEQHVRTYWNPYTFMGVESVASLSDSRPQYLPDPLLDAVEVLSEPRFAPQLWLLVTHLLGTLSIMALARRLWGARAPATLAAGLIWLLAVPILVPFTYGHQAQLVSDALLPVQLFLAHRALVAAHVRDRALALLGLAAALALTVLHGHPQIVVCGWMLVIAFALQQAIGRRAFGRFGLVALSAGLAVAMAMAVWWPALLYSAQSFRGGGVTPGLSIAEVQRLSPAWRDLLSLAWSHAVGYGGATYWGGMQATDYSPYLGVVAVVLALVGARAAAAGRATVVFLVVVVALAVVLSLGTTLGPIFGVVRDVVPFWSKFRVPFYVLIVAVAGLALLAARAGAPRDTTAAEGRDLRPWIAALAAVITIVGVLLAFGPLAAGYAASIDAARPGFTPAVAKLAAQDAGLDLVWCGLLASSTLLAVWSGRRRPAWEWALPALVAADLLVIAYPALARATAPRTAFDPPPPPPLARVVAAHPRERAYVGYAGFYQGRFFEAYTNHWISWRARCLTGLPGAPPDRWRRAIAHDLTRHLAVLRAWGVGYADFAASAPMPGAMHPVVAAESLRVFALDAPLGRAYAVRFVAPARDEDRAAQILALPDFDPRVAAVTTAEDFAGEYPGSERCVIRWLRDEPEELALQVEAPAPAFVVVADSDFPGWTATVDGRPTRIAPTNLLVRGVALPPGRHTLAMRYETRGMRTGLSATRLGWALWAIGCIAWLALARRRDWRAPVALL